ncbi:MAG TPA: hypothetical protein EYN44_14755 [Marinobacter salarius]|nr:hypothetical protein [Marinobacter salarius]HIP00837.1 hypothetical protein [Marinobacter salarius]
MRGSLLRTGGLGWSAGVDIFSLGKKNSLRSDTFFLAGKNIDPHAHRITSYRCLNVYPVAGYGLDWARADTLNNRIGIGERYESTHFLGRCLYR